jgi:GGDEF domain-containing protein
MSDKPERELLASHDDFEAAIERERRDRDMLLVKLLVTNLPIISAQFGHEQGEEVLAEIAQRISALTHIQLAAQASPVIFEVIAEDASNPMRFINLVKDVITAINTSGRFRFLVGAPSLRQARPLQWRKTKRGRKR